MSTPSFSNRADVSSATGSVGRGQDTHVAREPLSEFEGLRAAHALSDSQRFKGTSFMKDVLGAPVILGEVAASSDFRHFLLNRISERVAPGGRVLSVGPGTGELERQLTLCGLSVTAIELDPDFAALVRRRSPEVTLIEGDARDAGRLLPKGAPFDVVVLSESIGAVGLDIFETLESAGAIGKKTTVIVVGVELSPDQQKKADAEKIQYCFHTESAVRRVLETCGYSKIETLNVPVCSPDGIQCVTTRPLFPRKPPGTYVLRAVR